MAEVQAWTAALSSGVSFRQLLGVQRLWPNRPDIDEFADESAARGRLILTPCWFGGPIHIFEMDGMTYVGAGVRRAWEPSYRELAASISSNLKAFADPTRVAILLRLAREPGSVSEVARHFGLSQPAVSGHVQILREAGLLDEKSVGRRAILSANEQRVLGILSDAVASLQNIFGP
jgi:DNA-binding transcriptional ArsR family regulator